ncbi:choloylglycine hydrolase [Rhizobium sp. Root73]|nr:choloylglycine hydrolase [Rhizobium sp. Root1334]KRC06594.1 choloylglycine hydrolase [Rhizobium sp. Root73]
MGAQTLPLIILTGNPKERGCQHGAQLSLAIHAALARLKRSTDADDWSKATSKAAKSFQQLSGIAPYLTEELEGIALSTGLATLDIYLLSCFEYFADGQTGCTSAGITGPQGAIIAQNWDAPVDSLEHLAVLIHEDENERLVTIASAGTLGWVGMNGHGLAFVNNDLLLDRAGAGLPSLAIRRMMLAQSSTEDAVAVLRGHRHMSGRHYLFGDASGILRTVEISPAAGICENDPCSISHTNHPLSQPIAMWEDIEAAARFYPSSRERLRAARRHSLSSIDDIKALLRDTTGTPDSICKSWSLREKTQTAFSVIFNCAEREALIAIGQPDRKPFHRIRLQNGNH